MKGAKNVVAYDPEKEIGFYRVREGNLFDADSTQYFVFFPNRDAHQPGLTAEGSTGVKKLVIKVRVD